MKYFFLNRILKFKRFLTCAQFILNDFIKGSTSLGTSVLIEYFARLYYF